MSAQRDKPNLQIRPLKVCFSGPQIRHWAAQQCNKFASFANLLILFSNFNRSFGVHLKTALDIDFASLDADEQNFVENVRTHGWFGSHVFEDATGPGFSYTTGFWQKFGFPELILFSLPQEVSHEIFWSFYHGLEEKKQFLVNEPISEILNGYDVMIREVSADHFEEYLGWNRWFYGGDNFKARQVLFPDKSGRFPWSDSTSPEFSQLQPNLTMKSD